MYFYEWHVRFGHDKKNQKQVQQHSLTVGDVCSEVLVVQIQVHIPKYRCSADCCVLFHMPYTGRISNMNKINFTLFGNQVTKLLISTMTHNCFQIPFLYIKPFNWNYWFRVRTHWALPSLSFLLNLLLTPQLTEATHYSTCQSCKVCEISFPCFQRSPKYPTDT